MENKENFDYIIVGAGPAGLAFAHCCSKIGKKVLIIERESSIGGCHRVRRVNGLFTEHGPRIYSSTYKSMIMLLNDMSFEFEDLFTTYNFKMGDISGQTIFNTLKFSELFLFGIEFIKLLFNNKHGINQTVFEFMTSNSFADKSKDIVDRICRLTDGTSSHYYTLNKFLQLVNQQIMYTIYQPKYPNDTGIFTIWKNYLTKHGVEFSMDTELTRLETENGLVTKLYLKKKESRDEVILNTNKKLVILAIPPKNMMNLLKNELPTNLEKWSIDTAYLDYITITFHWNRELSLPKVYGFTKTDWGIVFIVLSDYMKFNNQESKTVISVGITRKDYVSNRINKIVDDCSETELIDETLFQLRQSFPELENPSYSLLSPGNIRSTVSGKQKWTCIDTAFITAANHSYLAPKLGPNLYTVGTHNGNHYYKFTSMESAITNGIVLANILEKDTKKYFKPKRAMTIRDIFSFIVILLIVYFLLKYFI